MARPTRQERQARRAKDGAQPAESGGRGRPPGAPAVAGAGAGGGTGRSSAVPHREPAEAQRRRGGLVNFVHESWAELKKVDWPTQNQVIQGTLAVLVACLIVGVFLYGADQAFKRLVQEVFLR